MKRDASLILLFCVQAGLAFFVRPDDLAASGRIEVDYSYVAEGAWVYPVQPGTEEWVDLGSTEKRREACQVPQEELDAMTAEALLKTALDYPFCGDMQAFDREEDGYRHQLMSNSALAALQERDDRHEVVRARLEEMRAWLDEAGQARSAGAARWYDCLTILERCME